MSILDARMTPLEELQRSEALTNEQLAEEVKKLNADSDKVEGKKKKKNKKNE